MFARGDLEASMLIVAICSVGLSLADNLFLHGRYQVKKSHPIVPGLEGCGIVTATSRGCASPLVRDKVGVSSLYNGGCAEEVLFLHSECAKLPDEISNL